VFRERKESCGTWIAESGAAMWVSPQLDIANIVDAAKILLAQKSLKNSAFLCKLLNIVTSNPDTVISLNEHFS
jgi:hypothetical protein